MFISKIWVAWFRRRGGAYFHTFYSVATAYRACVDQILRSNNEAYLQIFLGTDTWVSKGGVCDVHSAPMLSFALILDYPHGTTSMAVSVSATPTPT